MPFSRRLAKFLILDYSLILAYYFFGLAFLLSTDCLVTDTIVTIHALEFSIKTIISWMLAIKYFQAQKLMQKSGQNYLANSTTRAEFWSLLIFFLLATLANYGCIYYLRKECVPLSILAAIRIIPWIIDFWANNFLVYTLLKFLRNVWMS